MKFKIWTIIILVLGLVVGWFVFQSEPKMRSELLPTAKFLDKYQFRLGLDLSGGSELIYRADISDLSNKEADESLDALRDVIERRVNLFGVSEPVVRIQEGV